jgi:hypothetical protein
MAKEQKQQYYNTPIQLYKDFLISHEESLMNVSYYACYEYSIKNSCSFKAAVEYFGITYGRNTISDLAKPQTIGKKLYEDTPSNSPKVGIGSFMFWKFMKEEPTDFEKACLLAFLALKSIIQTKPYCKIDNSYLLSRMDGRAKKAKDDFLLSPEIKKFGNEYQMVKIKNELRNNWGLIYYSRYTRGFYFSFSMTLENLIFEAEKRRISTKNKLYKDEEKEALVRVMERLKGNTTK